MPAFDIGVDWLEFWGTSAEGGSVPSGLGHGGVPRADYEVWGAS